ncbi:TPM domain-containing protein [Pontixanthobacter aestiaquae]|uniref:Methanol dehydrogenase n=1 Tax=Pontixanthobacter aestiaquae TaxID=1509367 RepID=A0A844Z891_9SPHN|nr:TPM domain-containing protein [Pontixanthobacter aestiaquae]MDN3644864.1 TPM domain-containing protein [Pontixanthobacter aestiaquae]MXO84135.1 methanol dehydrogenase [Pontixanthobacter aestiaquae]
MLAFPVAAQEFPELTGRVVDAADIIPDAEEAALNARLEAIETQSQRQFVIATIPDLQGYDVADYGYQLGRAWGIGDAERNDGVLLIVAPNDRKTRIEVGYGLEPILTDGLTTLIVQRQMLPFFRDGDYVGGINIAADTIIEQLTLPEEEARAIAAQAAQQPKRSSDAQASFDIPTMIFLGAFFFFIILPMLRGARGKKYRGRRNGTLTGSGVGDIILWEVGSAVLRGAAGGGRSGGGWGGGGGGGGGGFGGGGFSGGGGSFGGGGASGGW